MMNFSQLNFGVFILKIHGFLLAWSVGLASWCWYRIVKKDAELSLDFFTHHYWKWMLMGVLGGRILTLALQPEIVDDFGLWSLVMFWEGGLNWYGFGFVFLGILIFDVWQERHSVGAWLDSLVTPFFVGLMLFDLVAFLTGGVYGVATNSAWWGVQYETFGVDVVSKVHPITLYWLIGHWAVWYWLTRAKRGLALGQKLLLGVGLVLLLDFAGQFLVGNPSTVWLGLKLAQWLDLLGMLGVVGGWFYRDQLMVILSRFAKNRLA